MNVVVIIGRCTAEPELKYTQTGKPICNFTLAVDRPFKGQDGQKETDFIRVVAWGKTAENSAQYLGKGKMAGIYGRLQVRNYEDKEGQKRTIAEVVADRVEFLSPKDGGQGGQSGQKDYGGVGEGDPPF